MSEGWGWAEAARERAVAPLPGGYVIETGSIVLADSSERLLKNPQVWASYLGQEDWEFETPKSPPTPSPSPNQSSAP